MYAVHPPGYHPRESNWQDFRHFTAQQLDHNIRPWLLDQGSLTQRLVKASQGHFQVQVLLQEWQRPRPSETAMLGMKPREKAIIREVALLCHGQPWVFARSVIPCRSLSGRLRRLRKFNNSSLGDMLFRDPSMRRSAFEITRIDGTSQQLPKAMRQATALWGRRCRFELAAKPIMVSEVFLPAFRAQLRVPNKNR